MILRADDCTHYAHQFVWHQNEEKKITIFFYFSTLYVVGGSGSGGDEDDDAMSVCDAVISQKYIAIFAVRQEICNILNTFHT